MFGSFLTTQITLKNRIGHRNRNEPGVGHPKHVYQQGLAHKDVLKYKYNSFFNTYALIKVKLVFKKCMYNLTSCISA